MWNTVYLSQAVDYFRSRVIASSPITCSPRPHRFRGLILPHRRLSLE
nr:MULTISPECIES: hypothetical protein [Agrobacterium]